MVHRALGYMAGALSPTSDSAISLLHSFGLIILLLWALGFVFCFLS